MFSELGVIVFGIFAELGIAERFVLEADLAFSGDGERLDLRTPVLKTFPARILGNQVLAVLFGVT